MENVFVADRVNYYIFTQKGMKNHYYLIFKWLYFHIKNYFAFYNYNYIMNTTKKFNRH
jgi:hypothetical protein